MPGHPRAPRPVIDGLVAARIGRANRVSVRLEGVAVLHLRVVAKREHERGR